jgi:hypothetical protein
MKQLIEETDHYYEFRSNDQQGDYKVEVQKDLSQLRLYTDDFDNATFIDTNRTELTAIRDMLNKALQVETLSGVTDNLPTVEEKLHHATFAMYDSIKQRLIENMADLLDDESTKLDEVIGMIKDPVNREESELHIRMANAAFKEYKQTMIPNEKYKEYFNPDWKGDPDDQLRWKGW